MEDFVTILFCCAECNIFQKWIIQNSFKTFEDFQLFSNEGFFKFLFYLTEYTKK